MKISQRPTRQQCRLTLKLEIQLRDALTMQRNWFAAGLLACGLLTVPLTSTYAADAPKEEAKPADKDKKDSDINLPPFPADKTVQQTITLDGHPLKYNATVG